jgi:hypothetical protein
MGEEPLNESQDASPKAVLICGLGLLGQHCAVVLKELGIPVYGLHDAESTSWEVMASPHVLDRLTLGDCRRHSALEEAGLDRAGPFCSQPLTSVQTSAEHWLPVPSIPMSGW